MRGRFIVIEGLDGAGKTTHTELLKSYLESNGCSVYRTAEPTDSKYGRLCRSVLGGQEQMSKSQLALVFTLDRIEHNISQGGIKEKLDAGITVLCDRYYYSTLAYQGVDVDISWLKSLNLDCPDIIKPDVCLFLDLSPEKSLERITQRQGEEGREIYENLDYLTKIRNRFMNVFEFIGADEVRIIDCDDTVEAVQAKIRAAVENS